MAYGKNIDRKDWLMRAFPLGVGEISVARRNAFLALRHHMLALMREMAGAAFSPEPLLDPVDRHALDGRLLIVQRDCDTLNSVWREQARMRVKPALLEGDKRYFKRLAGSLRFVDQLIPVNDRRDDDARRYFNIPETVQDTITPAEIAGLQALGESRGAIGVFRALLAGEPHGHTPVQVEVLRFIHTRSLALHRVPDFGAKEDFTLQLHIDARMLPSGKPPEALMLRQGEAFLLEDERNVRYHRFLDIAGPQARASRLRLPVVLTRKIARRIKGAREEWASIIVELSEAHVGVRLVVGKPAPAVDLSQVTAIVGRDYGYANTIALSVALSDDPVDLSHDTERIRADSKLAAKTFFESHHLPGHVRIAERVRFDGHAFLKRIATLCDRIDNYKSRIDLAYGGLNAARSKIVAQLGLLPDERITPDMKASVAGAEVKSFFRSYGDIHDLKKSRRVLYRTIAAIKKNWFGFLSNVEVALAKRHGAVIVREDLTVVSIEKASPGYKGRTFNKMLNNGSRGQYQRRASDKFQWNGVPEIDVPSWYTSRACPTHSVVIDKKHRKGEVIYLPCCGRHDHADAHAADTIATYLFLEPGLPRAAHAA